MDGELMGAKNESSKSTLLSKRFKKISKKMNTYLCLEVQKYTSSSSTIHSPKFVFPKYTETMKVTPTSLLLNNFMKNSLENQKKVMIWYGINEKYMNNQPLFLILVSIAALFEAAGDIVLKKWSVDSKHEVFLL